MSFELATQKAVYDVLQADSGVQALVVDVHDNAPQPTDSGDGSLFPYVVIGDDTWQDWSSDTETGGDGSLTVHTWSRKLGKKETKQIQAAVYAALNRATLTVAGYSFVTCDYLTSDSIVDSDGQTRHGVQTFRILVTTA